MRRIASFLIALIVAAWLVMRPEGATPPSVAPPARAPATQTPVAEAPSAQQSPQTARPGDASRGFRNRARLEEHYQKHGAEFGRVTIEDYLVMAQALRDAPVGGDVLETVRPSDGVISRFDRATGAFIAVDRDGTIRTFFKPNDGEAYFRRQANRRPSS
jgi:pyocin large subunit-like protein